MLTLRRRLRLMTALAALTLVMGGLYTKQRMEAAEALVQAERARAAAQLDELSGALDAARSRLHALEGLSAVGQAAPAAPATTAPRPLRQPSAPSAAPSAAPAGPVPSAPTPKAVPKAEPGAAPGPATASPKVEEMLRFTDSRSQPPPDARTVVVMGSKQMLRRDKTFYIAAFRAIGFQVLEVGDASAPLAEWSPTDRSWTAILCLSLTDGEEKCLHKAAYNGLQPYQRIGRLPGLRRTLWNKDAFCHTLRTVGQERFPGMIEPPVPLGDFSFECWVLPAQYERLVTWGSDGAHAGQQYIVKPISAGEGIGIKLLPDLGAAAPYASDPHSHVVQPYLQNPLLIHGYKFDVRTYVLVSSVSPLRAYMYGEGLVRFASEKHDVSKGRSSFLTNTAVAKKSGRGLSNITWSLQQFREHAVAEGREPVRPRSLSVCRVPVDRYSQTWSGACVRLRWVCVALRVAGAGVAGDALGGGAGAAGLGAGLPHALEGGRRQGPALQVLATLLPPARRRHHLRRQLGAACDRGQRRAQHEAGGARELPLAVQPAEAPHD